MKSAGAALAQNPDFIHSNSYSRYDILVYSYVSTFALPLAHSHSVIAVRYTVISMA